MPLYSAHAAGVLTPEEVGTLVVQPVEKASVATQVATVVHTTSHSFRIPLITADSSAAWTPEGEEITPSVPGVDEIDVVPKKLAALAIISNELAADSSSPEATQVVGDSIARDLARKIDAAFFAYATADGPNGIASVTNRQYILSGGFANFDPFEEAISAAETVGATVTAWITSPATALQLAKVKKLSTGSNESVLQPDPTLATRRQVAGVPLYVSPAVAPDEVWGIDRTRTFVVMRQDVDLVVDASAYFSSDRTGIRATMRLGFGFPHPEAVVLIGPPGS